MPVSLPLSVGLEIEFCSIRFPRGTRPSDISFRGMDVASIWPDFPQTVGSWVIKSDLTCGLTEEASGFELNSPILRTEEQLAGLHEACAWLSSRKAVVNHRCGVHVHLGVDSIPPKDRVWILDFLGKYEPAFFALVPAFRRRSPHCKKINERIRDDLTFRKEIHAWSDPDDRKCWVNGLSFERKGTLEFRLLEGTLSGPDIAGWVDFLLHVVTNCMQEPRRASSARPTRCQTVPLALHNMMVRCCTYGNRATDPDRARRAAVFVNRRYREIHGRSLRKDLLSNNKDGSETETMWKELQRELRKTGHYTGPVDGKANPELLRILAGKKLKGKLVGRRG